MPQPNGGHGRPLRRHWVEPNGRRVGNRCASRHSPRRRPMQLSRMRFCIGLPGTMPCHSTSRCSCHSNVALLVWSVPLLRTTMQGRPRLSAMRASSRMRSSICRTARLLVTSSSSDTATAPPSSIRRRQRYNRFGATPFRRATTEMLVPSSRVSSTIRSFSLADQRRRRPPSAMISISDISTCSGICLSLHGYAQVSARNGGQFTSGGDCLRRSKASSLFLISA